MFEYDTREGLIGYLNRYNGGESVWFGVGSEVYKGLMHVLKQPVLPAEPTNEMLQLLRDAWHMKNGSKKIVDGAGAAPYLSQYKALYAQLTAPPKPKTKKVWCVAYRYNGSYMIEKLFSEVSALAMRQRIVDGDGFTEISPVYEAEVPNND